MPRDEAARLADMHAHAGQAVRPSRIVTELALNEVDHQRIQFDRIDGARAERNRL